MTHPNTPAAIKPSFRALIVAIIGTTCTMFLIDMVWLGVVATKLYAKLLGPLKSEEVVWTAALLFYAMYIAAIVIHAVLRSTGIANAWRRGAELGFVAYATYELTNWAVIADWPALLVPIDIAWGVVITSVSAAGGRALLQKVGT